MSTNPQPWQEGGNLPGIFGYSYWPHQHVWTGPVLADELAAESLAAIRAGDRTGLLAYIPRRAYVCGCGARAWVGTVWGDAIARDLNSPKLYERTLPADRTVRRCTIPTVPAHPTCQTCYETHPPGDCP